MELIQLPEYVYKYISWKKDYQKKILLENEIYFPSVTEFNDPFDSKVPLRYDLGTDEQIIEMFSNHIRIEHPHLIEDEVKRVARNEFRNENVRNNKRIEDAIRRQRDLIESKYGVLSTSCRNDSILLWSHYSDQHQGVCLRFNCSKLQYFIEHDCVKNNIIIVWDKVGYTKYYPPLNPFELTDYDLIMLSLLLKSEEWKYEEELRFLLFDFPNRAIVLPDGIIDQIILGCKISAINKKEMIKIASNKKIEAIQSVMKKNSFGLDFINIDL